MPEAEEISRREQISPCSLGAFPRRQRSKGTMNCRNVTKVKNTEFCGDHILEHCTSQPHSVARRRVHRRRKGRKKEETSESELVSPRSLGALRCRERSKRRVNHDNVITQEHGMLDTNTFECYLENLWSSFSEEKRNSFAYLDCLWFSLYTKESSKAKVLNWIKKKHIFSKTYVFVPIVQWCHWSLLIFCHFGESLQSKARTPCMLLLDSLQMASPKRLEPGIRKFVFDIYKAEDRPEKKKLIYRIPLLVPKVPQQRNGEECGNFVLYYINLFLESAPENFSISEGYPYFMKEDWFTPEAQLSGLKKLDEYLLTRSYITGYQASKDDIIVHAALSKPPPSEYVNVSRWYNHIEALLRISGVSGEGCGVTIEGSAPITEAVATPPAADSKASAAEDDDDDDVDLFGEETEEEKKAAEARAAAVKASGKKKESGKSSILLDVKPWDDETDMQKLEEAVRSVQMEGLNWGASKLVPVGYAVILLHSTKYNFGSSWTCLEWVLRRRGFSFAFIAKFRSSINGPQSYPLIGCLISFYKNRRRLLNWYTDLLSESPTQTIVVSRFGARRTIVTANPDNVEYVLKTNFNNYPKGKPFTEILGDLLGHGIFNVDGELWNAQRKLASHEFSTKSLREFVVKKLEEEVQNRLVPLLESAAKNDAVLDLQDVLRRFAFDAVCRVSLGMDPNCLDLSRPLPPLVEAFDRASAVTAMRGVAPVFAVWKMKRVLNVGSEKKLKEAVELVHASVAEIIDNKKEKLMAGQRDCDGDDDLLSRLLSAGHSSEVVRDMVISFIIAGRDTTSAAMTWLFWLLSRHRSIEKEIVDELMSIHKSEKPLDYEDLKEMRYMKACLCESMRLYPPVAWDSKHASGDDVLPDGTPVYKGDRVTYFPYGMGRMEELWGKDRLEFKPDRWFDEPGMEGGVLKMASPYKFPVFQAGPRVCLGKEMAFIQMKYVVASILKRFEIKPVISGQPIFVPLLTAHMAGGFKVTVSKRSENSS
ncbi:hypothetical protein F0562_024394 [Nyssa sinensis]|uniref:Ubiquitin-like protease family profile domain-containing protein n=1 Tax=Nyssa sinensis TaxID=561372 RepID=A0A5J5BG38_9ASTE|nr:hypothetical protein F0562_024394 [Nyssa sinensis]